jgi:hypothetical protein
MRDDRDFRLARRLGPNALLRLRAEVLLQYLEAGEVTATEEERERLLRICVAPNGDDDRAFLGDFDPQLEKLDEERDDE